MTSIAASVQVYNSGHVLELLQCSFNAPLYDYGAGSQDTISNYNDLGPDASTGCVQNTAINPRP